MKTLIAVIASAFSIGAFAATPAPAMSASAPMATSSSMAASGAMKKSMKKPMTKKSKKAASAPAA